MPAVEHSSFIISFYVQTWTHYLQLFIFLLETVELCLHSQIAVQPMKQATLLAACIVCTGFGLFANNNFNGTTKIYDDSSQVKTININELLQGMLIRVGLEPKFELKEADVLNIEASVSHGKKYILYNPAFVNSLNAATRNNRWALMTLLAHEIGHHINGHTSRKGGNKLLMELQADEFAGYVMHKLGATLLQAQNVMFYIARTEDSKTHPARNLRLLAIEKGWNGASDMEEKTAIVAH
jgi:hypothetical protein